MPSNTRSDLLASLKEAEYQLIELCIRNKITTTRSRDYHDRKIDESLYMMRNMLSKAEESLNNYNN